MDLTLTEKQALVFTSEAKFIGFGGQAGGGKSVTIRAYSIALAMEVPNIQVYVIRKSLVQLRQGFMQGTTGYPALLSELIDAGYVKINYTALTITFWNGSVIVLKQLADNHDVDSFLGLEANFACFDEASTLDEDHIRAVLGRLRLGSLKVPDKWKHKLPGALLCTNPGGPAADFFKRWFIEKSAPMTVFNADEEFGSGKSIFIPCSLWENPYLEHQEYANNLKAVGDPIRIRQLLYGDFDVGAAAFFSGSFKREHNVVPDFKVPEDWTLQRALDPGFSAPYAYLLCARVKGQNTVTMPDGTEKYFPNDSVVIVKEIIGWNGKDYNIGLRQTHDEVATIIREKEEIWGYRKRIRPGAADSALWNAEMGADKIYAKYGVTFTKADKKAGSRMIGLQRMRAMFAAAYDVPVEKAGLYIMQDCIYTIATITKIETDPRNRDDVDTQSFDHAIDCARYFVNDKPKSIGYAKVTGL